MHHALPLPPSHPLFSRTLSPFFSPIVSPFLSPSLAHSLTYHMYYYPVTLIRKITICPISRHPHTLSLIHPFTPSRTCHITASPTHPLILYVLSSDIDSEDNNLPDLKTPLYILVNGNTASAAEVLSAALKVGDVAYFLVPHST